jgi:hypothetical protein
VPVIRRLTGGVFIALIFLILIAEGTAQVPAVRLEGSVQTSAGSGIAGAAVTAKLESGAWSTRVVTDSEGRFVFPALPPGEYVVTAESRGFRPVTHEKVHAEQTGAILEAFVLLPGEASEGESVDAQPTRLDTLESRVGGATTRSDLKFLPLLNRNPLDAAVFNPGVQINGDDTAASFVNGNRLGSNNVTLDGLDANDAVDPRIGVSVIGVNSDSVQHFSVITSMAKAEFGRNAGAQVLMTSRTGGSAWHGTLFDYFRNKKMNANDFFNNSANVDTPKYNQNLFGASAGGPIAGTKTFFFGNYEGRRTAHEIVRNRTVLTTEAKAGIFQWTPPNSTTVSSFDIVAKDPRKLGIDPKIASILKAMPDYNNTDLGDGLNTAGYRFNSGDSSHSDQASARVDREQSANHHLFFRYNWLDASGVDSLNGADERFPDLPEGKLKQQTQAVAAGSDYVLSPVMVNQLRAGYRIAKLTMDRPGRSAGPMYLANSWTDPLDSSFSRWRNSPVIQVEDNLSWIRGNHALKAGGDFRITYLKSSTLQGAYPNVTFARDNGNIPSTSIGPSGGSITQSDRQMFENLYNDLLGRMDKVSQTYYGDLQSYFPAGSGADRNFSYREYSMFVQDDWKFRPNVTLNLGVRYEIAGAPSEASGVSGALDKAGSIGAGANIADFTLQRGAAWYNTDMNNFAPRAGFAWSPRNSTKTVVRGGFGMFFERLPGTTANLVDANTPASSLALATYPNSDGGDRRVSDGVPIPAVPGTPVLALPATRSTSAAAFRQDLQTGYVQHMNLSFQHEVIRNTFVEVGYVGQRGKNLFMFTDMNQLKVGNGFLAAFKEIQNFRSSGVPVSSSNALARMFGSVNAAVKAIGGSALDQGLAGTAADTVDTLYYGNYSGASIDNFYLRNYPQFRQFLFGSNDGRSSYDAVQLSARRVSGPLKIYANYTWGKALDNLPADNCAGCNLTLDSLNPNVDKGPSDTDRPWALNSWGTYTVPRGDDPGFLKTLIGDWTIGAMSVWQRGTRFTATSGLNLLRSDVASRADYSGSNTAGALNRTSYGVWWFSQDEIDKFAVPDTGEIGNSGRNSFIGPNFFNFDVALTRSFAVRKKYHVTFRAEGYNVLNRTNFGVPLANLSQPWAFGKFTYTRGYPRQLQAALKFDF